MSRYPPRERSPPRHLDRRPSAPYSTAGSSYRGSNESSQALLDRAPPRGPKADGLRGGYSFSSAPRGRGAFTGRTSDTWDRDRDRDRDVRAAPPAFRRDDDRTDWPRRDRDRDRDAFPARDRPNVIDRRERSASPDRPRRNSRENIASPYGRPADSAYYGGTRGGSLRGRGRGDWERGRGRPSFVGDRERDGFYTRSRSREGWRDRDFERPRPSGPDVERNERFERRDYERADDRDVRVREHDIWQRDRSPGRSDTGRGVSPGAVSTASQHGPSDRHKPEFDAVRKSLAMAGPLSARIESRREGDSDYFSIRNEPSRAPMSATFQTQTVPQSSSAGLDYGPPPSVPATMPAAVEKQPPPKALPPKQEAAIAPVALQPPSGPKAERAGPAPIAPVTPRLPNQQFDQWSRPESASRSLRPAPNAHPPSGSNETGFKPPEPQSELRTPTAPSADRPLPVNIPSGPRAISGGAYKPRISPNDQMLSTAPPTAPRQPKAVDNRQIPNAPTGPRGSAFSASAGPHGITQAGSNRLWVNPDYGQRKPSIMNQLNRPYQTDVRDKQPYAANPRPAVSYHTQQAKPRIMAGMSEQMPSSPVKPVHSTKSAASTEQDAADGPTDVQMSLPVSDEDDLEDDDGLDEDYFAQSEESHVREMKLMESKKPLPPLQDPITAALLIRVQLLGMIMQGIVPEAFEESKTSTDDVVPMDLDIAPRRSLLSPENTPKEEDPYIMQPKARGRLLSRPFINPIPTPPIDDLPYLDQHMYELRVNDRSDASDDPFVFEDCEIGDDQVRMELLIEQDFERQTEKEEEQLEDLHEHYLQKYSYWKREIEQLEARQRELNQPSPAPVSPAPSATPSLPAAAGERPGGERTRGARNTTDLDMQQAILMSQQSAREEEERREREAAANAMPNYETEAVVPFMLQPSEQALCCFEDTSEKIPQHHALDFMAFIPPEDDFTNEEQLAFISAYCQNPKKWGKIASTLPNRSYQECITHYYLTKDQANYKEHWRRSQPKRRRGRQAAVKPRANNLMSDLAINEDSGGGPVAVTDSGRPRRAAAPTFGDTVESETAVAITAAKRPPTAIKDGTESVPPKPTRGRKAGTASKTRKPKDKAVAEQMNILSTSGLVLPQGTNVEVMPQKPLGFGKDKNRTLLKAESGTKNEVAPVPNLVAQIGFDASRMTTLETSPHTITAMPAPPVVTSYWSVPELSKFKPLVAHYGKDFTAIANFLKTKSSTMIRNHYQREVNNNGKTELEQIADAADQKRARGEPMGPPPSPVQPPKRRNEATPSSMSRSAIAATDQALSDPDPFHLGPKAVIEDFPLNSVQRNATFEVVAKPRPPRDISSSTSLVQPKVEEQVRLDRPSLMQKTSQGPPRGHFTDDNPVYNPQQRYHRPGQETSPHQHHVQMEMRSGDLYSQHQHQHQHPHQHQHHQPQHQHQHQHQQQAQPPPQQQPQQLQPQQQQPQQQQPQQQQQQQQQHQEQRRQANTATREHKLDLQRVQFTPFHHVQNIERPHQAPSRGHSRNGSLVTPAQRSDMEQAAVDPASLRSADKNRSIMYAQAAAHSPPALSIQPTPHQRTEPPVAVRPPPRTESAKPTPAKRSNLFGLLNDDPPEPTPKRTSTESAKRSVNTPPPTMITAQQPTMPQSRPQDEVAGVKPAQPVFNHGSNRFAFVSQEYRNDYSSSPGPPLVEWLDQFDPRGHESRSVHPSPALGPTYSLVPPNSQSGSNPNLQSRYESNRGHDPRRSHLVNTLMPSPPPQASTPVQTHGTSSNGSSSHQRGPSLPYSQDQYLSQPQGTGSAVHQHSTSSASLQGAHQRGQSSVSYSQRRRLTIQEHMAMGQHQREQDQQVYRRDPDVTNPQQQPHQSQQRSERPDIFALDSRGQPSASVHTQLPQSSQTPQPQQVGMGYQTQPPRTFTPDAYGQSGGAGSTSHGHHQLQHQQHHQQLSQSQQYQQHNQMSHQHQQHQQQQQQQQHHQQQQPHYGGPPSHQSSFSGRSLGPGSDLRNAPPVQQHQQQPQVQGHYRGYSQDERGR